MYCNLLQKNMHDSQFMIIAYICLEPQNIYFLVSKLGKSENKNKNFNASTTAVSTGKDHVIDRNAS